MAAHRKPAQPTGKPPRKTRRPASKGKLTEITANPEEDDPYAAPAIISWPLDWMPEFIRALAAIPNVTAAAQVAGVTREHASRTMSRVPAFKAACDEAKERGWELMERYGWQMGTAGVEQVSTKTRVKYRNNVEVEREVLTENGRLISPSMTQFFLRSRWPERYGRDVRVQHTGEGGGPIQHEIHRPLSADRALELARITLELEQGDVIDGEAEEVDMEGEVVEVEVVVDGAITSAGASTLEPESASTPDEPPLPPGVVKSRR